MAVTRLTTNGLTGTKYDIASADNYYMEPIATTLVGSGGVSSVTFSNIPNTYKHLQLRMSRTNGAAIRFNGDTTGSNYRYHVIVGTGASVISATDPNNAYAPAGGTIGGTVEVLDILDYANTNKFKTLRSLGGFDNNGSGEIYLTSNLWMNTAPITSMTMTATLPQHSRFSLYGIKG